MIDAEKTVIKIQEDKVFYTVGSYHETVDIRAKNSKEIVELLCDEFALKECQYEDLDSLVKYLVMENSRRLLDCEEGESFPAHIHFYYVPKSEKTILFYEYYERCFQKEGTVVYLLWNSKKEALDSNSALFSMRTMMMYGVNPNIVHAIRTEKQMQSFAERYGEFLLRYYRKITKKL